MDKIGSFDLVKEGTKYRVTSSEMEIGNKLVFASMIIEKLAIEVGVSQEEFVRTLIDGNEKFPGHVHINLGDL